jgi:hypothetical protein
MYIEKLQEITHGNEISVCIEDLARNGLSLDRFNDGDYRPARHEIAIFLAAWFRQQGYEPEDFRDWLIGFSMDVLSVLSASSLSKIRHSAKSTIKYVYRSEVQFSCRTRQNIFKAACSPACPLYEEMEEVYQKELEARQRELDRIAAIAAKAKAEAEAAEKARPKSRKEQFKKQFAEAVGEIKKYLDQGYMKKDIVGLLNKNGYKTKTGHDWHVSMVSAVAIENGWAPKRKKRGKKITKPVQLSLFAENSLVEKKL